MKYITSYNTTDNTTGNFITGVEDYAKQNDIILGISGVLGIVISQTIFKKGGILKTWFMIVAAINLSLAALGFIAR